MTVTRRSMLKSAVGGLSVAALAAMSRTRLRANSSLMSEAMFEVVNVERTTLRLEFRPVPRRNMDREIPHWRYTELCDVRLRNQVTGTGETLLFYTWGKTTDEAVSRVIGKSALEVMWDDSLGAGLQMALFDAVGKATEVPVHALIGNKVHQTTPLSWWNIDTSAADMAEECALAFRQGYRSYKTKGRPWYDVMKQVSSAAAVVPAEFKVDMDFNDTLRSAEKALPILTELEKFPQVDIYETPIPQDDVEGNRRIAEATRVHVAMHYGTPSPRTVVESGCCDGFVAGGGASKLLAIGNFCQETDLPFWLQLVGSGITAAYSLHFGGSLSKAVWPAVNCHQLFEHDLLVKTISLKDGHAAVPDGPGIGYEIHRDVVAKLRVEKPAERPDPPRLIETTWASGRRMFTANDGNVNFMLTAANQDRYPFFEEGADTRLVPDDGSAVWKERYRRARTEGPFAE